VDSEILLNRVYSLEIEGINNDAQIKDVFTAVQVEKKIKEILAQRDKQQVLAEQPTNTEIKAELDKIHQEKQELAKKIQEQERELERIRTLTIKNKQLEQRATELEKSLENINQRLRQSQLSHQAEKVANSDLHRSIISLQSEVKQLSNVLLTREQEVAQLKAINEKQQEEIKILSQYEMYKHHISDKEAAIIAKFGEIGE
jgi:chromosome segregation ATPase